MLKEYQALLTASGKDYELLERKTAAIHSLNKLVRKLRAELHAQQASSVQESKPSEARDALELASSQSCGSELESDFDEEQLREDSEYKTQASQFESL